MTTISLKKTIGILGGMGPAASADMYHRLIVAAQKNYHATQDTDFPPLFIYNLPLVGFDETGFTDPLLVRQQLIAGVKILEQAGSDLIIIACNTVHYFLPAMRQAVSILVVSIIEETVKKVVAEKHTCVGVLGSLSTSRLLVYQRVLENSGVRVLLPDSAQQSIINSVILHVMSGIQNEADISALEVIGGQLKNRGAGGIILGCTELPLAIKQENLAMPVFDTIQIIVDVALQKALA